MAGAMSEGERRREEGQVCRALWAWGSVGLYPGRVLKQIPLAPVWMTMAFTSGSCYKN